MQSYNNIWWYKINEKLRYLNTNNKFLYLRRAKEFDLNLIKSELLIRTVRTRISTAYCPRNICVMPKWIRLKWIDVLSRKWTRCRTAAFHVSVENVYGNLDEHRTMEFHLIYMDIHTRVHVTNPCGPCRSSCIVECIVQNCVGDRLQLLTFLAFIKNLVYRIQC